MNPRQAISATVVLLAAATDLFAQTPPGTVLWTYDALAQIESSPAVAGDGTIYVAGSGCLYAITNKGSNRWTFVTSSTSPASPTIGPDGTIYYGAGFNLYALDPSGVEKWHYETDGQTGSAAIGADGCIYLNTKYHLQAVTPNGTMRWRSSLGRDYTRSPSLYGNRAIFLASPDASALYSFSLDGTTNWILNTGYNAGDSPAVAADGSVYVTSAPHLDHYSLAATNLWSSETNNFETCSPVIGPDGTIYVSSDRGSLCAFTPTGEFKWQVLTNGATPGVVPAIDAAGTIYFPAYSVLYAISSAGVVQWSLGLLRNQGGDYYGTSTTSPCIAPDGTIYVTSANRLYAIAGTNKLADSPWPMYRQNARHTGKVEKSSLSPPQKRSDANFQFQLYAQLGQTNTVQTSTDLATWTGMTNIVITNVPMDVVDLTASNFPSRFYRAFSQ